MVTDLETLSEGHIHTCFPTPVALMPTFLPLPNTPAVLSAPLPTSSLPAGQSPACPPPEMKEQAVKATCIPGPPEQAGSRGWGGSQGTSTLVVPTQGLTVVLGPFPQSPDCWEHKHSCVLGALAKGTQAKRLTWRGACPPLGTLSVHCLCNFHPKQTPSRQRPSHLPIMHSTSSTSKVILWHGSGTCHSLCGPCD